VRPEGDQQQVDERRERAVGGVGAQQSRPADLPTGEQAGGVEAGQFPVRGRQPDAEPGREVGGGVVLDGDGTTAVSRS
jgi:hypothetical protein